MVLCLAKGSLDLYRRGTVVCLHTLIYCSINRSIHRQQRQAHSEQRQDIGSYMAALTVICSKLEQCRSHCGRLRRLTGHVYEMLKLINHVSDDDAKPGSESGWLL